MEKGRKKARMFEITFVSGKPVQVTADQISRTDGRIVFSRDGIEVATYNEDFVRGYREVPPPAMPMVF
jgi:hypothetical protein